MTDVDPAAGVRWRPSLLLPAAAALLLGSLLLFWLQPMAGRLLLPEYGGAASVWVVCLATFQFLLLAGYAYAWALSRLPPAVQRPLHLLLLAVAAAGSWRSTAPAGLAGGGSAVIAVLGDVLRLTGMPFVMLAAGSSLLQNWLARDARDRGVYRLYALSNLGSFAGLLLYPLLLEPFAAVAVQRRVWAAGMTLYVLAVIIVAVATARRARSAAREAAGRGLALSPEASGARPAAGCARLHFWLPCLSSALLVAITAHVTQQIIALPLVWALILGAFLLSYVIGFSARAERRLAFWRQGTLALLALAPLAYLRRPSLGVALAVICHGVALMVVAGVWLHGTLYAVRPPAALLPRYYLRLAAGGAFGGALTSLAAPLFFRGIWEFPLALAALGALVLSPERGVGGGGRQAAPLWLRGAALLGLLWGCGKGLIPSPGTIHQDRDFYGHISVWEGEVATRNGRRAPLRELNHGAVCHGQQYHLPGWRGRPLTYFGPSSGAALAIESHPRRVALEPLRVGVVGLGVGTLAAYGRTGDQFVMYEISPAVLKVATNRAWFTFLSDSAAGIVLKLGDGRKLLEQEDAFGEPPFDVLVLDAFAGDSPPLHLLTREAFELYLRRLNADGVLALNISSWHLNFLPVCKDMAARLDLHADAFHDPGDPAGLCKASTWVLLTRVPREYQPRPGVRRCDWSRVRDLPAPTDACGSALRYLAIGKGALAAFE